MCQRDKIIFQLSVAFPNSRTSEFNSRTVPRSVSLSIAFTPPFTPRFLGHLYQVSLHFFKNESCYFDYIFWIIFNQINCCLV